MSDIPEELQQRLPHEPKLWIRNFLRHPEDPTRPYDFYDGAGDEFLYYLVDEDGPMEPENWGDINVLLFCRGGLKTFTCTALMSWAVDVFPTIEWAATAPRDDQRYEVVERFKQKVEQSGLDSKRTKDKLSYQQFEHSITDEHGNAHTSYSEVKSRSAWGEGNALRGIHGHGGTIDEAQDTDEGTFSTFATEAIDREIPGVDYFPTIFVIGTPKMANTFFHKLWKMAEQRSWNQDKQEWELESDGDEFLPQELRKRREELLEEAEATDDPERAAMLRDEADGIEGFTVKGWHLDQHNSPLHDANRIAYKREIYSRKKFENEVLANFYSPEEDLLDRGDIMAAFDSDLGEMSSRVHDDSTVAIGVDWGGGEGEGAAKTVVTVGERVEDTIYVRLVRILDSGMSFREELEAIDHIVQSFDVDVGVVDEGFGDSERQELQDEYGHDNIYGVWYGHVKNKEELKWNKHKNQKRFFTANKPYMCRRFVEDFKSGGFVLPKRDLAFGTKQDKGAKIVDQLTAPYTDRVETSDGKKKLKVQSDRSDDVFDSFTYLWMAAHKVQSNRTLREIRSHRRPGY